MTLLEDMNQIHYVEVICVQSTIEIAYSEQKDN